VVPLTGSSPDLFTLAVRDATGKQRRLLLLGAGAKDTGLGRRDGALALALIAGGDLGAGADVADVLASDVPGDDLAPATAAVAGGPALALAGGAGPHRPLLDRLDCLEGGVVLRAAARLHVLGEPEHRGHRADQRHPNDDEKVLRVVVLAVGRHDSPRG